MSQYKFTWDDEKDKKNFKKHGIHFKSAIKIFLDPNKMIRLDEEHTIEERYNVIGKNKRIYFVVCAFRFENEIRIISARFANKWEKERYRYGDNDL